MIITNYANVYYKLLQFPKLWQTRQKLLQITVGITNCGVITNCVATVMSIITKANALKRSNVEVQTEVKKLFEAFLVLEEKGKKVKR